MTQLHLFSKTNINKHENDNWFSKHFRQKLPSQYTRNGDSKHQDFKTFWGPPSPLPLATRAFSGKWKISRFHLLTEGWTVWVLVILLCLILLAVLYWYPSQSNLDVLCTDKTRCPSMGSLKEFVYEENIRNVQGEDIQHTQEKQDQSPGWPASATNCWSR